MINQPIMIVIIICNEQRYLEMHAHQFNQLSLQYFISNCGTTIYTCYHKYLNLSLQYPCSENFNQDNPMSTQWSESSLQSGVSKDTHHDPVRLSCHATTFAA